MNKVETKHYQQLLGKRIVQIVESTDRQSFPGFVLNDGKVVWVQCDPEGNGPGFLAIDEPNDDPVGES